jgi:hypothetical protein
MNGFVNGAISDNCDVPEVFLHQQRQDQCLPRVGQALLDGLCAWKGKLNLRVERNIHTLVSIVKEVDLEAELGGADANSHGAVRFFRARQRKFNFHLGRKLMTKDHGHNSIIGIYENKINGPEFF